MGLHQHPQPEPLLTLPWGHRTAGHAYADRPGWHVGDHGGTGHVWDLDSESMQLNAVNLYTASEQHMPPKGAFRRLTEVKSIQRNI